MDGIKLFHQTHILKSPNIRNNDEIGVCFPPNVYFISSEILKNPFFRSYWSYIFWHEKSHVDMLNTSSIGSLARFIDEIAKYLIYFITPVIEEKDSDELTANIKRIIDIALNLTIKKNILLKYSKICNELYPTTYQIHKGTNYKILTNLIDIQNNFFNSSDEYHNIINFINNTSNDFIKEFLLKNHKENEHSKAFALGEKIITNFPTPEHLYVISSFALNIDISNMDFFSTNEYFEKQIKENPLKYNPDFRANNFSEYSVEDLLNEKENNSTNYKRTLNTILKIIDNKKLPNFLREKELFLLYLPEENKELMKDNVIKLLNKKKIQIITNSIELCYQSNNGTLFFHLPKQEELSNEMNLKIFLSRNYCYELLQRLIGSKTYTENVLKILKILLIQLDKKIPDKAINHQIIEQYLVHNYPESMIENIIPNIE